MILCWLICCITIVLFICLRLLIVCFTVWLVTIDGGLGSLVVLFICWLTYQFNWVRCLLDDLMFGFC